ncbi:MAG: helix-turn-helix domain-containing protein [Candidatus Aminicenantes bacterium]|nr:helix-turn-helix domain-containing protein [Candidatus Aminicenantes bacterium]
MSDKEYLQYFEILEITPNSSFSEVRNSYLHLTELYSNKSSALTSLMDTIFADKRKEILIQLKDAYTELKKYYSVETRVRLDRKKDPTSQKRIPEFEVFSGKALKLIREVMGIELEDAALATGIPHKHLKNIELEIYDSLPPPGYLKAYVKKYAEYLYLDKIKVTEDYMKRYQNRDKKQNQDTF